MTDPSNLSTAELCIELDALADVADRHGQLEEARVLFDAARRLRALTEWRPAGEVQPNHSGRYLVLTKQGQKAWEAFYEKMPYRGSGWTIQGQVAHPTHWREMPTVRELPEYTEGR